MSTKIFQDPYEEVDKQFQQEYEERTKKLKVQSKELNQDQKYKRPTCNVDENTIGVYLPKTSKITQNKSIKQQTVKKTYNYGNFNNW